MDCGRTVWALYWALCWAITAAKQTAEAQIGSAEAEATRLVNEAIKTADQNAREAILEARTRLSA